MKYSIIIPTYNHLEDCLKPCISSIVKNTTLDSNIEIIIVANGCEDGTADYLAYSANKEHKELLQCASFKMVWCGSALGYPKAINEGLKIATGDFIVLLNNDTVVLDYCPKDNWLQQLEYPFNIIPDCGITGVLTNYCPEVNSNFLIFACVMISRKAFNSIGYLDEIFTPGSSEDIDYCMRAKKLGFSYHQVPLNEAGTVVNGMQVTSFPLWHAAEKTVHEIPEWNEIFKRNLDIISKRYSEGYYK